MKTAKTEIQHDAELSKLRHTDDWIVEETARLKCEIAGRRARLEWLATRRSDVQKAIAELTMVRMRTV